MRPRTNTIRIIKPMMWQVMRDLPEKLRWIALIFNHLKNTWIKPEITRKISYNKKYSTAMEECLIYFWFEHVPFVVAYTKLYRANQILFQQNSSVSDICKIHYFQYLFFLFQCLKPHRLFRMTWKKLEARV